MQNTTLLTALDRHQLMPGVNISADRKAIIFCDDAGKPIHAFENKCQHNGGQFQKNEGCLLRCPRHQWMMDASSGEYVNPVGIGIRQKKLLLAGDTHRLEIYKPVDFLSSLVPAQKTPLASGELVLSFISHACVIVDAGDTRITFDPWCCGPAFSTGWWLKHRPPANWREEIARSDYIYVSHSHPDHLNRWTMTEILNENPNVNILVPDFPSPGVDNILKKLGARNIHRHAFLERVPLGDGLTGIIVPDGSGREDSGIYLDYKGHTILNLVDCPMPNNGNLPRVDLLMSSFAGGASGYPVCWGDQYPENQISRLVARNRLALLEYLKERTLVARPAFVMPFAGFFEEKDTSDAAIKAVNVKNTPDDVRKKLAALPEDTAPTVLLVREGWQLDVGRKREQFRDDLNLDVDKPISYYRRIIAQCHEQAPLSDAEIEEFFLGNDFADELILELLLVTEDFSEVQRRFIFDFATRTRLDSLPSPAVTEGSSKRFLQAKFRSDRFTHTLRNQLPIEELTIGFQGRFSRTPDVYNFRFWDYFQNHVFAGRHE